MEVICRGCLSITSNDHQFYSLDQKYILDLFSNCTGLIIDGVSQPNQICWSCLKKCELWDEFRRLCFKSDQKLKNFDILNDLEIQDSSDPNIYWIKDPLRDDTDEQPHECLHSEDEEKFKPSVLNEYKGEIQEKEGEISDESVTSSTPGRNRTFNTLYSCGDCNRVFKFKASFHKHVAAHKRIKLEKKDMKTKKDNMTKPIERIKLRESTFVCEECGENFTNLLHLRKHKISHTLGITKRIRNVDKLMETNKDVFDSTLAKSWTQKRRKELRAAGLPYYNGYGELVEKVKFKFVPCKCNRNCTNVMGKEDRKRLFDEVNALTLAAKRKYVISCIETKDVLRRTAIHRPGPFRRNVTCVYTLNGHRVCKRTFNTTMGISDNVSVRCARAARKIANAQKSTD